MGDSLAVEDASRFDACSLCEEDGAVTIIEGCVSGVGKLG